MDTGWDAVGDGLALWIVAGDGWEGTGGQVGVTIGVEVDREVSKVGWAGGGRTAVRDGVGCDGCGDVGVTAGVGVDIYTYTYTHTEADLAHMTPWARHHISAPPPHPPYGGASPSF